jgi:hypothetical protein
MKVFEYGDPSASTVLIQMVDDHDLEGIENEFAAVRKAAEGKLRLIAVKVSDWNTDLSPWQAPPVFGNEGFGSGAADTLEEVKKLCRDRDRTYYIGGYSLAGLFALWAAYQTDLFRGAAAASPSIWFPGFTDYMNANKIRAKRVYLSLGDREERTRNPVMATVGEKIREAYSLLKEQKTACTLEWNPGNHFREPDLRTAKAFAWVIRDEE